MVDGRDVEADTRIYKWIRETNTLVAGWMSFTSSRKSKEDVKEIAGRPP